MNIEEQSTKMQEWIDKVNKQEKKLLNDGIIYEKDGSVLCERAIYKRGVKNGTC